MPNPPMSAEKHLQRIDDWQRLELGNPVPTTAGPEVPAGAIYQFLRTSAESRVMAVNASGGDIAFNWVVPAGRVAKVERINWCLIDGSIRADGFGGLAPLDEGDGCLMQAIDEDGSTVLLDFMDGEEIRRHAGFGLLAGVDVDTSGMGNDDDALLIRWTLSAIGAPLELTAGQAIRFTVRADISDLTVFFAMLQGVYTT